MKYKTFEDMPIWNDSMNLAVNIFELTENLPKKEDYGLTSQIRRSALSISGNIAEAFGRKHIKNKLNFYYDARGSLSETKNYLIYGKRVRYFKDEDYETNTALVNVIWKSLNSLIKTLYDSQHQSRP